ncbi:MAG: hypothetical protein IJW82_00300 [Clostridia bacterium]|nr:hypothetical protein [Clostridia bacterium]
MKGMFALPAIFDRFSNLIPRLQSLLQPVLIAAVTAGFVYAVFLGVKLATAEDESKRKEAKKHIVTFVFAMVLVVFLLWIIPVLTNLAQSMF